MFHASKRARISASQEKADTDEFNRLFITSNFADWTKEETVFFFRYLVDHPHLFAAYTTKIEKDVLQFTSDKLLVEKVFKLVTEYAEVFNPEELSSNWQMIEYHVALFQHLQRHMKASFKKEEQNG